MYFVILTPDYHCVSCTKWHYLVKGHRQADRVLNTVPWLSDDLKELNDKVSTANKEKCDAQAELMKAQSTDLSRLVGRVFWQALILHTFVL